MSDMRLIHLMGADRAGDKYVRELFNAGRYCQKGCDSYSHLDENQIEWDNADGS